MYQVSFITGTSVTLRCGYSSVVYAEAVAIAFTRENPAENCAYIAVGKTPYATVSRGEVTLAPRPVSRRASARNATVTAPLGAPRVRRTLTAV